VLWRRKSREGLWLECVKSSEALRHCGLKLLKSHTARLPSSLAVCAQGTQQQEKRFVCLVRLPIVGFVFAVHRRQEIIHHKVGYFAAEPLARS